jgi:hypothetical protein
MRTIPPYWLTRSGFIAGAPLKKRAQKVILDTLNEFVDNNQIRYSNFKLSLQSGKLSFDETIDKVEEFIKKTPCAISIEIAIIVFSKAKELGIPIENCTTLQKLKLIVSDLPENRSERTSWSEHGRRYRISTTGPAAIMFGPLC